ncbi:hypothetical protein TNCV_2872721 [Trichonephila clavipes]|nr:hypothetical protein TNCV_2872721 [Trichonephila clavipes]
MSTFGITSTPFIHDTKNLSISTLMFHHHLPPKLNSCRPPLQYPLVTLSLNHLFLHVLMLLPRIWSPPLESSSSIIPTSSSQFIPPPSVIPRMPRNSQKARSRKRKKKNY